MEVFWCHIMPGSIRQIVLEGYPRRYFTFWLVNYVAWMLDINVFSVFSVSYTLLVQFSLQKAHDSIRKAIASISGVSPLRIAHLHVSTQLFFRLADVFCQFPSPKFVDVLKGLFVGWNVYFSLFKNIFSLWIHDRYFQRWSIFPNLGDFT